MRRVFVVAASLTLLAGCIVIQRETRTPATPDIPGTPGEDVPKADPRRLVPSSDRQLAGSLGWALLSPDVPGAVVEIDQLGDARLSGDAISAIEQALREHGGKQTVDVVVGEAQADGDVYSRQDLVTTAEQHRDHSSGEDTVALHVLVLPGRFEAQGVPGVAFHATTVALFPQEIGRMLPPGATSESFEAAVAVHELGHTFGLVNLTGVGEFHESSDHPRHTDDEDSVMYWAIESPSLRELFRTGPPRDFNEADRREMEAIRQQRP